MTTTLRHLLRSIITLVGRQLLRLRYDIEVRGLEEVRRRGTRQVVFLPSHVALIDPAIMMALLDRPFHPHGLGDEYQLARPLVGTMARLFGVRPLPSMERQGLGAAEGARRALEATIDGVRRGENLLFYPSGRLRHGRLEEVRATSGTEILVKAVPEARLVLVRQTGLWGSSFSRASGRLPHFFSALRHGLRHLLLNGLLFMPRRKVLVEFEEPADFPRDAGRMVINRYLEAFYNERAPHNTYVPYTFWERGGSREVPEPPRHEMEGEPESVAPATKQLVFEELARLTGQRSFRMGDRLAHDLGLDSLAAAELALWVEKEFGFPVGTPESLVTVGDVVLAASGRGVSALEADLKPASPGWLANTWSGPLKVAEGRTITEVFLNQAARDPRRPIMADQQGGERTYRQVITALHLLVPIVRELPGRYVGIMLPASAGAGVFYLAALFAGKTPVMVNWTTGTRNLAHSLDVLGVQKVITARALLTRLGTMGFDLSALGDRFLLAEDLRARLTLPRKLLALARAYGRWGALRRATPPSEAVVLFTSGSENLPKAVPLTHTNLLTNIRDVLTAVDLSERDILIGMLPPFHSFGISITTILPLIAGLRVVYHPNPTEASVLARVIEAYRVTILVGTPTFLSGIVRAARPGQLDTLRMAVTGAEKCPDHVYQALEERCAGAMVLEGYGITECSPVVSANRPGKVVRGSIGTLLPSVEGVIVSPETGRRVAPGEVGMLLVRGRSIFSGYLQYSGESPFVDFEGQSWYRTGDLVRHEPDGVLFFEGRLKRFVKLGGEMISLPAIETVLSPHFARDDDTGPAIAVETLGSADSPDIVLFTCRPAERDQVNQYLRQAGLSPLHNVRKVITVDAIPVLGTGKTDYRGLKEQFLARV
jgi:long-chain-fatty-acid--[acyl-carrier-protein] ligase